MARDEPIQTSDQVKRLPGASTSAHAATFGPQSESSQTLHATSHLRGAWRWLFAIAKWLAAVLSGVIVALLGPAALDQLKRTPPAEQLRQYISSKRADGWQLIAGRQVQLQVAGERSWLLVFRDSRKRRSDQLDVLRRSSGTVRQVFSFEAAPQRPKAARVPSDRSARPFNLRLDAVADLMGATGAEQVLLTLGGPDYHLRYPLVLWVDQFSQSVRLSPAFTGDITIGPRASAPVNRTGQHTLEGVRLMRTLYSMPTRLRDITNREPTIATFGADSVAVLHRDGQVFLAAGFVVAEADHHTDIEPDSHCIMDNELDLADVKPGTPIPPYLCPGFPQRPFPPAPEYLNIKAWRFNRQGIAPATTFCGGSAFIAKALGAGSARPLREHWVSYFNAGRLC
jgi:hypothetical protein